MKKDMKLNIGGHTYTILECELNHEESDKELYGRHLVKDNLILINESIQESRQYETLMHEILHAIFYNYGLDHDESRIDAISNGLFQLGMGDYLWTKSLKKS